MMTSDCIPHQEREAERAAAHAKKEAERAASLDERETEMEARRATKKAEERSQIRKAEAEERLRKKLCADGFQLPARTDHSQLAPAVWDALLPQLPKRTGASAPPGSPVKLREAMPGVPSAAVGDLLFVCDFVRALGPALALPAECAAAGRLSQLILTHQHLNRSSVDGAEASATSGEAATPPMAALVSLHRQLLHVLLHCLPNPPPELRGLGLRGSVRTVKFRNSVPYPASLESPFKHVSQHGPQIRARPCCLKHVSQHGPHSRAHRRAAPARVCAPLNLNAVDARGAGACVCAIR
jgi:hypothetical protein